MNREGASAGSGEPSEPRIDRTALSVAPPFHDADEKAYWLSRTPHERLCHQEYLRRMNYGERASERIEKVLEILPHLDSATELI